MTGLSDRADIGSNLSRIQERIRATEVRYHRPAGSVSLVAVSKTQPPAAIAVAAEAGQRAFGENYPQEALAKMEALAHLALEWHFIGPLQSNKTKSVAENFDWIHSVDRIKIARRLSLYRRDDQPALNCCLQINLSGESTKRGVSPQQLVELALAVAQLPRLRLRGLMAIPAPEREFERQRRAFRQLRLLFEHLGKWDLALDTLSMGMTADLEAAIAEGATLVRVGTALFGMRRR